MHLCPQINALDEASGGKCGTRPLGYYPPNEVYSASKCRMECEVDSLFGICQCTDAYMPDQNGEFSMHVITWLLKPLSCSYCIAEKFIKYKHSNRLLTTGNLLQLKELRLLKF
jgi:hypothetical protein